jgi:2Fe-2S iron-sulfur cluster binding domain
LVLPPAQQIMTVLSARSAAFKIASRWSGIPDITPVSHVLQIPGAVHVEYSVAKEKPNVEGGFTVRLARSNKEFVIPAGKTILQVLRESGMDVPYSCQAAGQRFSLRTRRASDAGPSNRDVRPSVQLVG